MKFGNAIVKPNEVKEFAINRDKDYLEEIERLNNIINKAIEYIETYKESFKNYIVSDLEFNVYELLDILKEKEEER